MRNRYGSRAVTPTTNQPGFWQTIGDQIPGLARGAYSGLLGLPGDVEEMAVSAAPYALLSQGKISPQRFSNLATQDYSPGLLTSEEIADPLRKEGLLSKRPLEGEYTELAGMFLSPDMFVGDIAKLGALGVGASIFTSPAQKAVREVAQEALPSQQWLKQLEGRGVKKDELEWTGLLNFLKEKKGNIPKSEVEDFIEANKIDVQEVHYAGKGSEEYPGDLRSDWVEFQLDDRFGEFEAVKIGDDPSLVEEMDIRFEEALEANTVKEDEILAGWSPDAPEKMPYKDNYVMTDPYGEYMRDSGGGLEVYRSEDDAFQHIRDRLEDEADSIPDEDLMEMLGFDEFGSEGASGRTKFDEYQLPGGENYRELVLTVDADKNPYTKKDIIPISTEEYMKRTYPAGIGDRQQMMYADHDYHFDTPDGLKTTPKKDPKATDYLVDDDADIVASGAFKSPEEALEQVIREMNEVKKSQPKYTGGHYEEPNVLSHIRFNERVDPDGNKVLFIEEIQSDWAQKGRKVGFSEPIPVEIKAKLQKELSEKQAQFEEAAKKYLGGISARGREQNDLLHQINVSSQSDFAKYLGVSNEEAARIHGLPMDIGGLENRLKPSGVQKAPFLEDTNQWAGLSMKRMIKWASDEGFDSIAWTTGKQQAKRYDLSKQIDSITYDPASKLLYAYKKDNYEPVIRGKFVEPENLDDYIGKEAAKKLLATKLKKMPERKLHPSRIENPAFTGDMFPTHILEGQELEIGGEGMAGFYDKILVDQAKKIGKKHGAKVEKVSLSVGKVAVKPEPSRLRYEVHDEEGAIDAFETREAAENALETAEAHYGGNAFVVDSFKKDMEEYNLQVDESIWKMKLPSKLKEAAKGGLPYYALVPPGLLAVGAQRERQSLLE